MKRPSDSQLHVLRAVAAGGRVLAKSLKRECQRAGWLDERGKLTENGCSVIGRKGERAKKHRPTEIVLEREDDRVSVHRSQRADLWLAANRILRSWNDAAEVTYEVHYDDGEVFVGHLNPGYGDSLDIAARMRSFCEFYSLRRIPSMYTEDLERYRRHMMQTYVRVYKASVRWLDEYEIGSQGADMQFEDTLPSRTFSEEEFTYTPAPMTPSWS
jgi:hypothetical protein